MLQAKAIKFPIYVNGLPMTASVVEVDENPVQYSFHIRFSDGYENIFTLDEGVLVADKADKSKPYISAIRNDIPQLIGLDPAKFYHVFPEKVDGITTNIWIIEKEDEFNKTYYGVYYNEYYRFEVRNVKDQWIYSTRSKEPGAKVNEDIAKKVIPIVHSLV